MKIPTINILDEIGVLMDYRATDVYSKKEYSKEQAYKEYCQYFKRSRVFGEGVNVSNKVKYQTVFNQTRLDHERNWYFILLYPIHTTAINR